MKRSFNKNTQIITKPIESLTNQGPSVLALMPVQLRDYLVEARFIASTEEQQWKIAGLSRRLQKDDFHVQQWESTLYHTIFDYIHERRLVLQDDVDAQGNFIPALEITSQKFKECFHFQQGKPFNLYSAAHMYQVSRETSEIIEAKKYHGYMTNGYYDRLDNSKITGSTFDVFASKYEQKHRLEQALENQGITTKDYVEKTYQDALPHNRL